MTSLVPSGAVLRLYRNMLRASYGFSDYGFRNYALRRVRQGFIENRNITDPAKQTELLKSAQKSYELIQRQSLINRMYSSGRYYIESPHGL